MNGIANPARWLAALASTLIVAGSALAQSYPDRAVRVVVPWPPGQATDLVARIVAQKLAEALGQPFVVENKAGAGGAIGTDFAAKAAPDGYTLLAASSGPVTINPIVQKVPYDVDKQLVPVHGIGLSPYILVTAPGFPAKDAREFVDLVKRSPDKYSFGSSGSGATAHLVTEWFNSLAGLKAVHVPYKGSVPALADVMSGNVAYAMETLLATGPLIRGGKLKAYGISTARASAALPDVKPLREIADMPPFDVGAWLGWMFPAGTPSPVIARIADATGKVLQQADTREKIAALGLEIDARPQAQFAAYLKEQQARFREIVKTANIKAD